MLSPLGLCCENGDVCYIDGPPVEMVTKVPKIVYVTFFYRSVDNLVTIISHTYNVLLINE